MRYTYKILLVIIWGTILFSCGKETDPYKSRYGYYKFSFKEDNSSIEKTKAGDPIFAVKIVNAEGVTIKTYEDHRVLETEPLKLKAGKYSIVATTGQFIEAGFEKPFYKGEKEFVVESGSVGSANVVCTLANVKVTIQIDKSVKDNFKEYIVTVSNTKDNGALIYNSDNGSIDKEGYFNCSGKLTWTMYLVNNNGTVFSNEFKGTIDNVNPKEHYRLKFKLDETEGASLGITIGVDPTTNEKVHNIPINLGLETTAISVDPWAKHAFLFGKWNTPSKPVGLAVEYKKASESTWTKITSGFSIEGNKFNIKISDLQPNTAYVFRTLTDKGASNEITFNTQAAEQISNMGFDAWYKDGKTYYPNESAANFWWDSGNKGANTLSELNPTSPTTDVAVSGTGKNAAKLESKSVFGILAAGSIYLGKFDKTIGTSGAQIYFGRPYTCRPLSMKGYYNYKPGIIDKVKGDYVNLKGQHDFCQIYVLLADWTEWYRVNTSEGRFIDINNDPAIIAYGEMTKNSDSNGYQQFEIPLTYRNGRIPTHCVIVASASKYGDFFTGAVGSVLLIDEFEFTF